MKKFSGWVKKGELREPTYLHHLTNIKPKLGKKWII